MGTQVKETVTQMKTIGLEMDAFDDSPYSLMLLNNATQNEETTSDQRSGAIFPISTSHENIHIQAKGAIN